MMGQFLAQGRGQVRSLAKQQERQMREPESFDAFYAKSVANVTSQMHELAGGDPQADHAVREAYARAYQQWFEVSGFRDPEGWVLDAAKDALTRRQAQTGAAAAPFQPPDNGTWPGMYREAAPRARPADLDSTVAPAGAGPAGTAPAGLNPPLAAQATAQAGYRQDAFYAGGQADDLGLIPPQPGPRDPQYRDPQYPASDPALTGGMDRSPRRPDSKALIAGLAACVLVAAAAGAYFAFGRGSSSPAKAAPPAKTVTKGPKPAQMLAAGKVGQRLAVPWSLVGTGWTVAEVSSAQPGSGGPVSTELVDPKGGRYNIAAWPATAATTLVAWSGNADSALYRTAAATTATYSLLNLKTGTVTPLHLPAGLAITGFTRPDGTNLLAIAQGPVRYKLQRYNLDGTWEATLASMVRRPGQPAWTDSCASGCGALSSPDGLYAVWGVTGDEMQLVGNAGGMIRRLHVPGSGTPSSCTPMRWWNTTTVLASCAAASQPGTTRLWLVPMNGSAPTALTLSSGSGSGAGFYTGAWLAAGGTYVTATSMSECAGAASGPGGLGVLRVSSAGSSTTAVSVPGADGNSNAILGVAGGRLLMLAQTSCPGTSSLFTLDPSSGSTTPLLMASSAEAGVVTAVTYGAS
jgi:hypothetical protein